MISWLPPEQKWRRVLWSTRIKESNIREAQQGIPLQFDHHHIKAAFDSLVLGKKTFSNHRFAFFIDGLDEFEGRESNLVRSLFDWVDSNPEFIKIRVSSRELPIFQERFSGRPKLRLHELTQSDIILFVNDVLLNNEDVKAMDITDDFVNIGALIVEKAEGMFLWVSLVLTAVEEGIVAGDSAKQLGKKIDFLPSQVDDLFQVIFESIEKNTHPIDRHRAMIILDIVLHSHIMPPEFFKEPTLLGLSFLDEFIANRDFVATMDNLPPTLHDIERRLKLCQKQIDLSCRGFVSTVSKADRAIGPYQRDFVTLTHRSLVDFLLKPEIRQVILGEIQDFDLFQFRCQSIIGELQNYDPEILKDCFFWTDLLYTSWMQNINCLIRTYLISEPALFPHLFSALKSAENFTRKHAAPHALKKNRYFHSI
jgi:hypothetical protein